MHVLREYPMGETKLFSFTTGDGVELNCSMITPPGFDPDKKYPVLLYIYGGPGSQTVEDKWGGSTYLWHQMLAQKGYIVVSVDNRGTGFRGKAFKQIVYRNLGEWEVNDNIETAKYLGSLSFVDKDRIGIWGWSYGGYVALLTMCRGAEYFKTGVAVAPVTHWMYYDDIYTERYMSTPKENPEGYRKSSPLTYASLLKGNLLIIHGTSDDNVHWQNTITMVDTLIKANKQFETAFYPGKDHSIRGGVTRENLFTKMTEFIIRNL
jgi:dipeptidyl-peptidase-4